MLDGERERESERERARGRGREGERAGGRETERAGRRCFGVGETERSEDAVRTTEGERQARPQRGNPKGIYRMSTTTAAIGLAGSQSINPPASQLGRGGSGPREKGEIMVGRGDKRRSNTKTPASVHQAARPRSATRPHHSAHRAVPRMPLPPLPVGHRRQDPRRPDSRRRGGPGNHWRQEGRPEAASSRPAQTAQMPIHCPQGYRPLPPFQSILSIHRPSRNPRPRGTRPPSSPPTRGEPAQGERARERQESLADCSVLLWLLWLLHETLSSSCV